MCRSVRKRENENKILNINLFVKMYLANGQQHRLILLRDLRQCTRCIKRNIKEKEFGTRDVRGRFYV